MAYLICNKIFIQCEPVGCGNASECVRGLSRGSLGNLKIPLNQRTISKVLKHGVASDEVFQVAKAKVRRFDRYCGGRDPTRSLLKEFWGIGICKSYRSDPCIPEL